MCLQGWWGLRAGRFAGPAGDVRAGKVCHFVYEKNYGTNVQMYLGRTSHARVGIDQSLLTARCAGGHGHAFAAGHGRCATHAGPGAVTRWPAAASGHNEHGRCNRAQNQALQFCAPTCRRQTRCLQQATVTRDPREVPVHVCWHCAGEDVPGTPKSLQKQQEMMPATPQVVVLHC